MIEITLYETEDGKRFEDYKEAEDHEIELMFGDVKGQIEWRGENLIECELYDAMYVRADTQNAVAWFNYCMEEQYGIDCPIPEIGYWMFNGNEFVDIDSEIYTLTMLKGAMGSWN